MPDPDQPQLYLITPPQFDLPEFSAELAGLLDTFEVSCVRMGLPGSDADTIGRAADGLREVCYARDVALVIEDHFRIVQRHGLDGVHLTDGARSVREVRKELGADAIVGSFCNHSRHTGLSAGEIGADYVAFGPVSASVLGDGTVAGRQLFEWWSEVVEVPVVAEGGITPEMAETLAPITDFLALGPEIWDAADGARAQLAAYMARIR
jgi:thiamine-phosphate pyrophosphorylase